MSEDSKTKKDNVVGIGNNNTFSKEQYEKAVNSLHQFTRDAREVLANVRTKYERAFTGYWHKGGDKLVTHEKHEQRIKANGIALEFNIDCIEQVEAIEEKARARGLKLDKWETVYKPEDKNDE